MEKELQKLTLEQALVLTGYTGVICCPYEKFIEDVCKRLDKDESEIDLENPDIGYEINQAYEKEFMYIIGALDSVYD